MKHTNNHKRRVRDRSGIAIIELAVCLPAIVLLVLGSIEACTMVFVKQSLHISAYEGVRSAIKSDGNAADAVARANRILDERGVKNASVEVTPRVPESADLGTAVTVRITAPAADNSVLRLKFFSGDLESEVTMSKE